MIRYRAPWVVPIIGEPIENGWVDVADGFIVDDGSPKKKTFSVGHPEVDSVSYTHLTLPTILLV